MAKVVPTCFDNASDAPLRSSRKIFPDSGGSFSDSKSKPDVVEFNDVKQGNTLQEWELGESKDAKPLLESNLSGRCLSADSSGDERTTNSPKPSFVPGDSSGDEAQPTRTPRCSGKLSPLTARTPSEGAPTSAREEMSLTSLFTFLSSRIDELTAGDEATWSEFSNMTQVVYNKAGTDSVAGNVKKTLTELGYSPLHGWRRNTARHVSLIFQKFSNLYLSNVSKQVNNSSCQNDVAALTFCPDSLFCSFSEIDAPQVHCKQLEAAVLLADISGFSKYAGKMCLQGTKGLDTLHKVTNEYLGRFVNTVYQFNGDVISFAGDALLCIFPVTPIGVDWIRGSGFNAIDTLGTACARALQCAYAMRQLTMQSLSAHFAVSCGLIEVGLLGGIQDEWVHLMSGRCVFELAAFIDVALPKQVICSKECANRALQSGLLTLEFAPVDNPEALLLQVVSTDTAPSSSLAGLSRTLLALDNLDLLHKFIGRANYFIPRPVQNALFAGSLTSIAELRRITVMFLKLDSYSPDCCNGLVSLQPFLVLLQELLVQCGGFLRQFLIDDKGCVAIAMWGVPSYTHSNDCSRGLHCAWNILAQIGSVGHRCSIGLASGYAYCGVVGAGQRRDYVCMGDKVNVAARLMSKARGRMLVDPEMFPFLSYDERKQLVQADAMKLKGMPEPVSPYVFSESADFREMHFYEEDKSQAILRKDVVQRILFVLDAVSHVGGERGTPFLSTLSVVNSNYHNSDLKSAILVGDVQQELKSSSNDSSSDRAVAVLEAGSGRRRDLQSDSEESGDVSRGSNKASLGRLSFMLGFSGNLLGSKKSSKNSGGFERNSSNGAENSELTPYQTPRAASGRDASPQQGRGSKRVAGSESSPQVTTTGPNATNASPPRTEARQSGTQRGSLRNAVAQVEDNVRNCRILLISGASGSGKSAAAKFFRKSCTRRRLRCVCVSCGAQDTSLPLALAGRLFWELAGRDKYRSVAQKKQCIVELVGAVRKDVFDEVREQIVEFMCDVLIEEAVIKRRMTTLQPSASTGNMAARSRTSSVAGDDDDEEEFGGFSRQPSAENIGCFGRTASNDTIGMNGLNRTTSNDTIGMNEFPLESFASQDSQVEYALDSFLSRDSQVEVTFESLRSLSDCNLTAEDVCNLVVEMIRRLITIRQDVDGGGYTCIIIEDAHYSDDLSWSVINAVQAADLHMVFFITLTPLVTSVNADERNLSNSRLNTESTPLPSQLARTISDLEVKPQLESIDSETNERVNSNYQTSDAYVALTRRQLTVSIDLGPLTESEVRDVLKHACTAAAASGTANPATPAIVSAAAIPAQVVERVISVTGGNAFWVRQVARYMRDNGMADLLGLVGTGSALAALHKLIICQLERMSTEQQLVLKYASVLGEEFTIRLLAAVLPASTIPGLRHSIITAQELGLIHAVHVTDRALAVYRFHNTLTRNTICLIVPPSEASDIHLRAAKYIEKQFAASLRQYYASLSYHYSQSGHRKNAFKYTMKAADQAISKGSYGSGLEMLLRAKNLSRSTDEASIVHRVAERGLQDVVKGAMKRAREPAALRGSFSRQLQTVQNGQTNDAALTLGYHQLKESLEETAEPIVVQVAASSGGAQVLQLRPLPRNAPLMAVKEVSERDIFGAFRMMSFMSNRSMVSNNESQNVDGDDSSAVIGKLNRTSSVNSNGGPAPPLQLQLSYTEARAKTSGKNRKQESWRGSFRGQQQQSQVGMPVEEGSEEEEESSTPKVNGIIPRNRRQFSRLRRLKSRLSRTVFAPVNATGRAFLRAVGNGCGCVADDEATVPQVRIPIRRRSLFSGPGSTNVTAAASASAVDGVGTTVSSPSEKMEPRPKPEDGKIGSVGSGIKDTETHRSSLFDSNGQLAVQSSTRSLNIGGGSIGNIVQSQHGLEAQLPLSARMHMSSKSGKGEGQ